MSKSLNSIPFVSVENMLRLIKDTGVENCILSLVSYIEEDFRRWELFDKTPRVAAHSDEGVIELMPTSDGIEYGFKYVNGHPKNTKKGMQTVTAFGVLSSVETGYPLMLSEMTLLTALRTAATSAVVAKYLARKDSKIMAMIGNGAQSEFQAIAMHTVCGIDKIRLYDVEPAATKKCEQHLRKLGFEITVCDSTKQAIQGADIITTCTADKQYATILTDEMVHAGVHLNAIGGDCPGKTELEKSILLRSDIFVEYTPQTRIEGEIQQLSNDHNVTEMWQVITGQQHGRRTQEQITLFDGVGFATEDFSALRWLRDKLVDTEFFELLDIVADPKDPRNLFGLIEQ